jgi:catechol 2,3-dioxygenase-like lactoylglutathione lyase family enzyme
VSVHAIDMEASIRFYVDVFGMEQVPSPDFEDPVTWLQLDDQQLHLFLRDDTTSAPPFHHLGLDVDDFEAVYLKATELGVLDRSIAVPVRELPGGEVQMYLRDPAGNLVEVDWPDAATLDRSVMGEIPKLADFLPQSEEALEARLYRTREATPVGGGGE